MPTNKLSSDYIGRNINQSGPWHGGRRTKRRPGGLGPQLLSAAPRRPARKLFVGYDGANGALVAEVSWANRL